MLYYNCIIFIAILIQGFLIAHIIDCTYLEREEKRTPIVISGFIILEALCEVLCLLLSNGNASFTVCMQTIEVVITPIVIIKMALMLDLNEKLKMIAYVLLAIATGINLILTLLYGFVFYSIYSGLLMLEILIFEMQAYMYGKKWQAQNNLTLIAMFVFFCCGLIIQSINEKENVILIILSIEYLMFMLYYGELRHATDRLTGLLNRHSYEAKLRKLNYETIILILDLNCFKQINDKYGHQAGDIVLQKIGNIIKKVYQEMGSCYRIGGDEFAVILKKGEKQKLVEASINYDETEVIKFLNKIMHNQMQKEKEKESLLPEVAVGGAIYTPGRDSVTSTVKAAIKKADENMYKEKAIMKQ